VALGRLGNPHSADPTAAFNRPLTMIVNDRYRHRG
jgi:hypothetical protein